MNFRVSRSRRNTQEILGPDDGRRSVSTAASTHGAGEFDRERIRAAVVIHIGRRPSINDENVPAIRGRRKRSRERPRGKTGAFAFRGA